MRRFSYHNGRIQHLVSSRNPSNWWFPVSSRNPSNWWLPVSSRRPSNWWLPVSTRPSNWWLPVSSRRSNILLFTDSSYYCYRLRSCYQLCGRGLKWSVMVNILWSPSNTLTIFTAHPWTHEKWSCPSPPLSVMPSYGLT